MAKILGKNEIANYDAVRLKTAVQKAAQANAVRPGDAVNLAAQVVRKVENWLAGKPEITARELRLATVAALSDYDAESAYLYENENKLF